MLDAYQQHAKERATFDIPPRPLDAGTATELVSLLKAPPAGQEQYLLNLFTHCIPPGVDEAAKVKANFLSAIARGEESSPLIQQHVAIKLLGTMQGGYNVAPLITLLDDPLTAKEAATQLKHTLLIFDAFQDVEHRARQGNAAAREVIQSWADAEWFLEKAPLADKITLSVFKVPGETNTDDLSPGQDAWSRPDIPLHAMAMLKQSREGICPDKPGEIGPLTQIKQLRDQRHPVVYVGDVVGTGSSRKSATNSLLWYFGKDIPFVPNKRAGGFCFGGKIAPIFFNTLEDAGALPVELDVSALEMGDVIDLYPYEGKVTRHGSEVALATFTLKTQTLLDEVRAGGRIPLIIGRGLTQRARESLSLPPSDVFISPEPPLSTHRGFTLAQKIVGKACNLEGVRPGTYCEPHMTTVGSQDTTGPMTRDELKDLACLDFQADLFMQSFCHTAAYPKPVDVETHQTLPEFIMKRGGISLRPGDGIIHSWLNRMLLPDTVGTGGDSHTRFPLGISFPAGSGLVAFAAATGVMPLDMPESVLVRFTGELHSGITLRDLVHAIPLVARQQGMLTVGKSGKKNVFSGRILEIEGLDHLTVEQAFELSDASAERSAAGCTISLAEDKVCDYLRSNVTLLKWMFANGYGNPRTLERRIQQMEEWLAAPQLLRADEDADYAAIIEIDLATIDQPILCAPNDPDDARVLTDVAGTTINEVFIGSCMTNIGHFRAVGKLLEQHPEATLKTRLWLAPPTKMDQATLKTEGYYALFEQAGARVEIPGCSLCMGNQARVADGATVISTSTRNFPHRLGNNANVFLASAELAAITALLGHIPTPEEYESNLNTLETQAKDIYRYMSFDHMPEYNQPSAHIIAQG